LAWKKVNLTCSCVDANIIEEILIGYEAISISMVEETSDKPIYEPALGEIPLWDIVELSALFAKNITRENIINILEVISYKNLKISLLENQNWVMKYQNSIKPKRFGKKLWVIPSWSNYLPAKESINLILDPGMAFGSGSHETTHLCLEYLERAKLNGLNILDYGCGSGILSIASLLLGANIVIATDIDPQALKSTRENSKINNVIEKIHIAKPSSIPNMKIDLIIANIFSNILIDNRNVFSGLIKTESIIVLSGIMRSQLETILEYYKEFFTMLSVHYRKDWCLVELVKK